MSFAQGSRARRHSGVSSQARWAASGLNACPFPGPDVPRPQSAPPVASRWPSLHPAEAYATEPTQCGSTPSDSSASSDESSPPSTRPPSPSTRFAKKESRRRVVHIHEPEDCSAPYNAHVAHVEERVPAEHPRRTVYVVLERASMEICRAAGAAGSGHPRQSKAKPTLLTCDDHQGLLVRMGRDASDARPDITHQCLLTLLDSPLNKAGLLRIFVHTTQDVLIEVHPDVRIPRTYKRYSGLMVQLLQEGEIRGASDAQVLLRVLKHPLARYLPADATKIALSADAPLAHPRTLAARTRSAPLVLLVGAMAKGADDFGSGIAEERASISSHALSASVVLAKLCCAVEDRYGIL